MDRAAVRESLLAFITVELMEKPSYPLRDDEHLFTRGLVDSMAMIQIAMFIEAKFDIVVPESKLSLERADTLQQIVDLVIETANDR